MLNAQRGYRRRSIGVLTTCVLLLGGATSAAYAATVDALSLTPNGLDTDFSIAGVYPPDTKSTTFSSPNAPYSVNFSILTAPSSLALVDTTHGIFGVDTTVAVNSVDFPNSQIAFFTGALGGGLDVCLSEACGPQPPSSYVRWVLYSPQLFTGNVSKPTFISGNISIDQTLSTFESPVPEPASMALLLLALGSLSLVLYFRRERCS